MTDKLRNKYLGQVNADACCENCPYWHRTVNEKNKEEELYYGSCRRFPPSIIHIKDGTSAKDQDGDLDVYWPVVGRKRICGEHPDLFKKPEPKAPSTPLDIE